MPRYIIVSKPSISYRRVDGRGDYIVKSMAIALYRDESIRRIGGL